VVLVTRNPIWWLAGMAVSLIIAAIIYFAVIKSSNDTANNAIKTGEQQAQQVIQNANKQIQQATKSGGGASAATSAAQSATQKAAKLAACIAQAGTDVSKVQSCQAQFQ
jgi:flagellar biosynthesis/type III secretory pathway M-ring protein FliF/YscJ